MSAAAPAPPLRPDELGYEQFLAEYLLPNQPVVLSASLTTAWPARQRWTPDDGSSPNWSALAELYGDHRVSVTDCGPSSMAKGPAAMRLREVVELWQHGEGRMLYVKDWHLARSGVGAFYTTPDVFRDDWMNAFYCNHSDDDFRFVYAGPAGTLTPIHRDVYCSYSWSTNIAGTKRWHLFPPDVTAHLRRFPDRRTSELIHDIRDVDAKTFPRASDALERAVVVDQQPGETIFVPSGWYHQACPTSPLCSDVSLIAAAQVENTSDCISLNHNWCNAVPLRAMYASLCDAVEDVEAALDDVRESLAGSGDSAWYVEWQATVQRILKLDAGWDWSTFWSMVAYALRCIDEPETETTWPSPPSHLRPPTPFVLDQVEPCLRDFLARPDLEWMADDVRLMADEVAQLCTALRLRDASA